MPAQAYRRLYVWTFARRCWIAALEGGSSGVPSCYLRADYEGTMASSPPYVTLRAMRPLLVACLALALAAPAAAALPPRFRVDRGIVQSVGAGSIVLRELDGSSVSIPVDAGT